LLLIVLIVVVAGGGDGGDDPPPTTDAVVTTAPDTTAETTPTTAPAFTVPDGGDGSDPLLDQTALDTLETDCAAAVSPEDFLDCDFLFFEAAPGSAQQDFGGSCADTVPGANGTCGTTVQSGLTVDTLVANCGDGDNAACDELFLITPIGSRLELFGDNCAGRAVDQNGSCESNLG
jgi:hypothetical protein